MIKTNINTILVGGFIIVVLLMVGLAIYSVNMSQKSLQESVGESSVFLAEEMLTRVDLHIYRNIEMLQGYSKNLMVQEAVLESNKEWHLWQYFLFSSFGNLMLNFIAIFLASCIYLLENLGFFLAC